MISMLKTLLNSLHCMMKESCKGKRLLLLLSPIKNAFKLKNL